MQFALQREWERKRFEFGKGQPMGRPSRLNEHVISPVRYCKSRSMNSHCCLHEGQRSGGDFV